MNYLTISTTYHWNSDDIHISYIIIIDLHCFAISFPYYSLLVRTVVEQAFPVAVMAATNTVEVPAVGKDDCYIKLTKFNKIK